MRITKWAEYGILFSIHLAKRGQGESVGAAELAETFETPIDYVQQICQRLRKGGIFDSVRGPKGGYKLSRTSSSINLKEILIAAEGATFEVICEENPISETCQLQKDSCGLHTVWTELKENVDSFLADKSLEALAQMELPDRNKLVSIHNKDSMQNDSLHSDSTQGLEQT